MQRADTHFAIQPITFDAAKICANANFEHSEESVCVVLITQSPQRAKNLVPCLHFQPRPLTSWKTKKMSYLLDQCIVVEWVLRFLFIMLFGFYVSDMDGFGLPSSTRCIRGTVAIINKVFEVRKRSHPPHLTPSQFPKADAVS